MGRWAFPLGASGGGAGGGGGGLSNIVEDTSPQLGGALDVNGQKIVSVTNGDIDIEPNGTGNVLLGNFVFNADQTVGAGQDNYVLTYDNASGLINLEAAAGGGGGGASTALDNLASVAINTSLISDTDATDDLGSSSIYWRRGYFKSNVATDTLLNLKLHASQTSAPVDILSSGGTSLFSVKSNGKILVGAGAPNTAGIAGFADSIQLADGKLIYFGTSATAYIAGNSGSSGGLQFGTNGGVKMALQHSALLVLVAGHQVAWNSGTAVNTGSTADCGMGRAAAGSVKVTDGSTGWGRLNQRIEAANDPTTTELPNDGDFCIYKNTSSGNVYLAHNNGGTIVKTPLS